jgi:hypothetical protein
MLYGKRVQIESTVIGDSSLRERWKRQSLILDTRVSAVDVHGQRRAGNEARAHPALVRNADGGKLFDKYSRSRKRQKIRDEEKRVQDAWAVQVPLRRCSWTPPRRLVYSCIILDRSLWISSLFFVLRTRIDVAFIVGKYPRRCLGLRSPSIVAIRRYPRCQFRESTWLITLSEEMTVTTGESRMDEPCSDPSPFALHKGHHGLGTRL